MRFFLVFAIALSVAACASTPDVATAYRLAKTDVRVQVIRTVGCDKQDNPVIATSVVVTPNHSADYSKTKSFRIQALDGFLSDADAKVELYDDGRLKGLNATTTGQGEAVLKSAISVASSLGAFEAGAKRAYPDECAAIRKWVGDKPLTLTFEGKPNMATQAAQELRADAVSAIYFDGLKLILGAPCATPGTAIAELPVSGAAISNPGNEFVQLELRQPARVPLVVDVRSPASCGDAGTQSVVWIGSIPVAQLGKEYSLPVPKAALFGKQTFAVALADSGAITTLQYAKTSGAPGVLGVLAPLASEASPATQAAHAKSEADLIAQQERLVRCRTNPAKCS